MTKVLTVFSGFIEPGSLGRLSGYITGDVYLMIFLFPAGGMLFILGYLFCDYLSLLSGFNYPL
ncbi:MAG: hypothetical protein PF693_07560 [Spirochaetia bacterium]|nr:hypothetical protein [Spirochaetia bacterium]